MRISLSQEEKEKIEYLYQLPTQSFKGIGRIINRDYRIVKKYLESLGYKVKDQSILQRKYPINETFFDIIDTQEKAYILGFLYADGSNSEDRNSIIINIVYTDKDILDKITNLIQPLKPIRYTDTSNQKKHSTYKNSKNQYRLVIANKHISKRLSELGCGKLKTHSLMFPTEDQVPKHLHRHFIRGFFDGDGSVSGDKQKQISFTGTEDFLIDLQKILMEELNFSKTKFDKRWKDTDNSITSLRYGGRLQCIKFRDWIYDGSTIFLNRKKEKFYSF